MPIVDPSPTQAQARIGAAQCANMRRTQPRPVRSSVRTYGCSLGKHIAHVGATHACRYVAFRMVHGLCSAWSMPFLLAFLEAHEIGHALGRQEATRQHLVHGCRIGSWVRGLRWFMMVQVLFQTI